MRIMFDTNIFNRIADGQIDADAFKEYRIFATHIQMDEIQNTRSKSRREELLLRFSEVQPTAVPTESMVWDVSRWDECKWPSGDVCAEIFAAIKLMGRGRKPDENYWRDALIAETAIKNDHLLLTEDADLRETTRARNGKVMTLSEFAATRSSSSRTP